MEERKKKGRKEDSKIKDATRKEKLNEKINEI